VFQKLLCKLEFHKFYPPFSSCIIECLYECACCDKTGGLFSNFVLSAAVSRSINAELKRRMGF